LKRTLELGVDIGGTFTDFVLGDRGSGEVWTWKALSSGADPAGAVLAGIDRGLAELGIEASDITRVVHATTLVTNSIIERKGAKVGLLTSEGFVDVLDIARELRYDLYDLFARIPEPLVAHDLRRGVKGRIDHEGQTVTPLNEEGVTARADELYGMGIEALAICFVNSYANTEHEARAADLIRSRYSDWHVSVSSEVAREVGEYERTTTVTANAFVQPLVHEYIDRLYAGLKDAGIPSELFIMLSSGGFCDVSIAGRFPIRLLESGPAAGAVAGAYWGQEEGIESLIGFDMGGTTAKVCLVKDAQFERVFVFEAARVHRFKKGSGLPILAPSVELIEIGAGGGSIARIDQLGLISVGPESSGSEPGPASYDRGGIAPTVTDADLILGYLNEDYFLGGEMALNRGAAESAVSAAIADSLGLSVLEAAWGIHTVVNENMASAARVYLAEKGSDSRELTLVATGGAGPVHAYGLARALGCKSVLYPYAAGVGSAVGLLVAPAREDLVQAFLVPFDGAAAEDILAIFSELETEAATRLLKAGVREKEITYERLCDLRYVGQGQTVTVRVQQDPPPDAALLDAIAAGFRDQYELLYGASIQGGRLEFVNIRTVAERAVSGAPIAFFDKELEADQGSVDPGTEARTRNIFVPTKGKGGSVGELQSVPVFDRRRLQPGFIHRGPCIVEEIASTIVLNGPGLLEVRPNRSVIVELIDSADNAGEERRR